MAYEESTVVREQGAEFADTGPEVREADTGMEAVSGLQDMYDLLTDTMEAGISSYDPVEGSQSAVSFEDVLGMTVDQPFVDYAGDVRESADLSDLCAAVNNMGEEKGVMNMGSDAFEDALERYCQDMGEAVDKDALSALTSDMAASMEEGMEIDQPGDVDIGLESGRDALDATDLPESDPGFDLDASDSDISGLDAADDDMSDLEAEPMDVEQQQAFEPEEAAEEEE